MALRYSKRFVGYEVEILGDIRLHSSVGAKVDWDTRDYLSWTKYVEKLKNKAVDEIESQYDVKQRALITSNNTISC